MLSFRNRDRWSAPSRQEYRLAVSASLQKVIEERKVHAKVRYEKNEVSYTSRRSPTFLLVVIPGVFDIIFPFTTA